MATKLGLYNAALRHLGEVPLASLTEARASRRALDAVYDNDFIKYVLEAGQWNFATRASELTYEPSITPSFGYSRAFSQPDDYVRPLAISADEFFNVPLLEYSEETGYWFCDHDTLYVKYVSNDSSYGGNLGVWPATFTKYAELHLAEQAAATVNPDKFADVVKLCKRALVDALSKDAMADPTKFLPMGSWAASALGNSRLRRSRIGFER